MRLIHFAILPAAIATLVAVSSVPVRAQAGVGGVYDARGGAYDNGYRRGYEMGQTDARSGRASDFRRERDYRNADWGYDRSAGSRDTYRRRFRDGFETGYNDAFRGRRAGQRRPLPPAARNPGESDDRYGTWGYGTSDNRSRASTQIGFNYGFNDGYERGLKAARSRKPFDPRREDWYRDGDRHYDSAYGPRDPYKAAYRDGFARGYEEGYGGGGNYRRH